jgi:hypothetical protein
MRFSPMVFVRPCGSRLGAPPQKPGVWAKSGGGCAGISRTALYPHTARCVHGGTRIERSRHFSVSPERSDAVFLGLTMVHRGRSFPDDLATADPFNAAGAAGHLGRQ